MKENAQQPYFKNFINFYQKYICCFDIDNVSKKTLSEQRLILENLEEALENDGLEPEDFNLTTDIAQELQSAMGASLELSLEGTESLNIGKKLVRFIRDMHTLVDYSEDELYLFYEPGFFDDLCDEVGLPGYKVRKSTFPNHGLNTNML